MRYCMKMKGLALISAVILAAVLTACGGSEDVPLSDEVRDFAEQKRFYQLIDTYDSGGPMTASEFFAEEDSLSKLTGFNAALAAEFKDDFLEFCASPFEILRFWDIGTKIPLWYGKGEAATI